jgi:hypothetical protein
LSERRFCWLPWSLQAIMGERLAAGNVAMALLANTLATGAALVTLILTSARFPVLISTPLLHWRMLS